MELAVKVALVERVALVVQGPRVARVELVVQGPLVALVALVEWQNQTADRIAIVTPGRAVTPGDA